MHPSTTTGSPGDQIELTHDLPDVIQFLSTVRDLQVHFGDEIAEISFPSPSVLSLVVPGNLFIKEDLKQPVQRTGATTADIYMVLQGAVISEKIHFTYVHHKGSRDKSYSMHCMVLD